MKSHRVFHFGCFGFALLVFVLPGCDRPVAQGSLVLTKVPSLAAANAPLDVLAARYPIGSRVVLRSKPFDAKRERLVSGNLVAAGSPVLSYDGQRVFFVGKAAAGSDWQIYETALAGWGPRAVTSMSGGAMSPTLLPNGNLVFISPVPKINTTEANQHRPTLFEQAPGDLTHQLTFGPGSIVDSTMLSDGRILFIALQRGLSNSSPECALYTINNDGTEITTFAEENIPASLVQHPRQILADSGIAFVVSQGDSRFQGGRAEFIRMNRPCLEGAPLLSNSTARVLSVEVSGDDDFLVCAETVSGDLPFPAVFRVRSDAAMLGPALVADSKWSFIDAVEAVAHRPPMGRLSTVDFTKRTGKILCLDVNFTRDASATNQPASTTTRVRVTAEISPGAVRQLGEVAVQTDGSFLAEVPADVLLGFDLIDDSGRVLRTEPPSMWVRPGENRSCVGCHAPSHRAPHNRRPLAVSAPVPVLSLDAAKGGLAQAAK